MAINGDHMLYTTHYGSEVLLGMKTKVYNTNMKKKPPLRVEYLADSGASASIMSFDLAIKLKIKILDKRDATLKDASNKYLDVSRRGEVIVQE